MLVELDGLLERRIVVERTIVNGAVAAVDCLVIL